MPSDTEAAAKAAEEASAVAPAAAKAEEEAILDEIRSMYEEQFGHLVAEEVVEKDGRTPV